MYQKSFVHYAAKAMVDILFYVGIICVISEPIWIKAIRDFLGQTNRWAILSSVALVLSGICAVLILFNLKCMFKTLLGGNPFVEKNVQCLRQMAVFCALIAMIYFVSLFVIFTFARLAIIIIFAIACLFCLTLKDIFKQAICYKEENELTI